MAYQPDDPTEHPEDRPDDPDPVEEWVARHLATAPPLTQSQRTRIAYRLARRGAA